MKMKAVKHFFGYDTYGRSVERAQGVNGAWFARHTEKRGRYGMCWTKWYEDDPTFETEYENKYSGEICKYNEPVVMWGLNRMDEIDGPHRIRLPNN